MRKKHIASTLLIFFILTSFAYTQNDAKEKGYSTLTKEAAQAQVDFLSSDWMEGRATGQKGEYIASDYIASMFKFSGVKGAGDKAYTKTTKRQRWDGVKSKEYTSYFQNISLQKKLDEDVSLSITSENGNIVNYFEKNVDFSFYGSLLGQNFNAELVFVGYGYQNKELGYDDFKKLDIKNKVIVRLSGFPGHKDTSSHAYNKVYEDKPYFEYYLRREKNKIAKEKGALAVIEISSNPGTKRWIEKPEFLESSYHETKNNASLYKYSYSVPSDNIPDNITIIRPSVRLGNRFLDGIDSEKFEKECAVNLKPASIELKDIKINFNHKVNTELIKARNVIGVIEGENKDEIVVIGGHYDHLGVSEGHIWNGADDNASGTVGVLMLAKAFAESGIKPKKTIVFAAWTGEEIGMRGSRYFTNNPYGGDISKVKLYVNFDMISKSSESDSLKNQVRMTYTSSLTTLEENSKNYNKEYDLNIDFICRSAKKPRGGSDFTTFAAKDVPVISLVAGFPITYHTPEDETKDINWDKMLGIVRVAYLNLWDYVNE